MSRNTFLRTIQIFSFFVLLFSFVSVGGIFAQPKFDVEVDSVNQSDNFDIKLVVDFGETEVDGFELEMISNDVAAVEDYAQISEICDPVVISNEQVLKVICLAKPGSKITGLEEILLIGYKPVRSGEFEVSIQNIVLSGDQEAYAGGVLVNVEMPEKGETISIDEEEEQPFITFLTNWYRDNYNSLLYSIIAICLVVVIVIFYRRRRSIPMQLRLLSYVMLLVTSLTIAYTTLSPDSDSQDTTADAGVEINNSQTELESKGADLNGDGLYDDVDYQIFKNDYIDWQNEYRYYNRSDFNDDRTIDVHDYTLFVEEYERLK